MVGVTPQSSAADGEPLAELKELLRTAGVATAGELIQRRDAPDPDRYLGRGKLAELKAVIAECDANVVATDDELAPRQERNLESELGVPVGARASPRSRRTAAWRATGSRRCAGASAVWSETAR